MATKPTIELDFDNIKSDIIAYIKNNPTFSDYNFEGSALNTLIDVLAYNTHTNAYYANMLHNEGFIETAQKRASVVSRAKELGYIAKSATCSRAIIDIAMRDDSDAYLVVPRGVTYTSTNESGTYTFVVTDDVSYTASADTKTFNNINLVEGVLTANIFYVNTLTNINSIFTIPNTNVDISTLKVYVAENLTGTNKKEYKRSTSIFKNAPTDEVYFIQESYEEKFQIFFGKDITGKQPTDGYVIFVEYVVTNNKSKADGCKVFYANDFAANISNISTVQQSFGGADKEDITSIKTNAVKYYPTKHRAITENDYAAVLKEKFNFIKSVIVWGGENNDPPVYGKIFISIQPITNYVLTDSIKNYIIQPALKAVSIPTVRYEIVDPEYTDLEFTTTIKFNKDKTFSTKEYVDSLIKAAVVEYVKNISQFNTDYINLGLIQKISAIDPGIVSVDISKKVGFIITPSTNINFSHKKTINNQIVSGTVTSSRFNIYKDSAIETVSVKEISGSEYISYNLQGLPENFVKLGLYNSLGALLETVGYVNLNNGYFDFALTVYSYKTDNKYIYVKCVTVNTDIVVKQNQILKLRADIEDSVININSSNIVNTTLYAK